jgi:hypothetical protein
MPRQIFVRSTGLGAKGMPELPPYRPPVGQRANRRLPFCLCKFGLHALEGKECVAHMC